jgi:hypothetical protein
MNLGPTELVILGIPLLFLTFYGLFRASRARDNGWAIGIIVGFFFMLGWLVATVYLLAIDHPRRAHA